MDCIPSGIGLLGPGGQGRLNVDCEEILQGVLHIYASHSLRTSTPITTADPPSCLSHQCSLHVPTCSTTGHCIEIVSCLLPNNLVDDPHSVVTPQISIL